MIIIIWMHGSLWLFNVHVVDSQQTEQIMSGRQRKGSLYAAKRKYFFFFARYCWKSNNNKNYGNDNDVVMAFCYLLHHSRQLPTHTHTHNSLCPLRGNERDNVLCCSRTPNWMLFIWFSGSSWMMCSDNDHRNFSAAHQRASLCQYIELVNGSEIRAVNTCRKRSTVSVRDFRSVLAFCSVAIKPKKDIINFVRVIWIFVLSFSMCWISERNPRTPNGSGVKNETSASNEEWRKRKWKYCLIDKN